QRKDLPRRANWRGETPVQRGSGCAPKLRPNPRFFALPRSGWKFGKAPGYAQPAPSPAPANLSSFRRVQRFAQQPLARNPGRPRPGGEGILGGGAAVGHVPPRGGPAVGGGEGASDPQPQTKPAAPPAGIGTSKERVKHAVELVGRDSNAVVYNGDHHIAA